MNPTKHVAWFADDPKPNVFFYRSLFRSGRFILITASLVAIFVAYATEVWKNWTYVNEHLSLLILPLPLLIYPPLWVIKMHGRIREIYLAGGITEQPAGSPLDQLLHVADEIMNAWLITSFFVGIFLLIFFLPVLRHLR